MSAGDPARAPPPRLADLTLSTGLESKAILWEGGITCGERDKAAKETKEYLKGRGGSRTRVGGKKLKKEREGESAKGTRQAEGDTAGEGPRVGSEPAW